MYEKLLRKHVALLHPYYQTQYTMLRKPEIIHTKCESFNARIQTVLQIKNNIYQYLIIRTMCFSFINQTSTLPYGAPCSQYVLFRDNGSHWKHILHDWLNDNMISCCVSVCLCNYPWQAGIPTNTICKVHSILSAHSITRLIGSFMQRTACGFNTFRCWYTVCDVHYYRHTYAMCVQGWTSQNIIINNERISAERDMSL
jgi:hypothetical protein